jgi:putative MATE family efflux protein
MDLTTGRESKLILSFTIPLLIGNVFQQLYAIIDSVIVGHFIGKEGLAVIGAAFPVIFLLISLVIGIASGSTIMIAQYFGAKDIKNIRRTIDTMYIFLFSMAIITSATGMYFSSDIFRILKLPPNLIPDARLYLNVYLSGLIFFFGFNGNLAILRGLGDSKTPMFFLAISTLVNIGLDFLFVLVFKTGIVGIALATVIAQAGAFITSVIYLNRTHEIIHLSLKELIFDRKIFKTTLKIGIPSGLQQTFVALGMMALIRIVNDFGTDAIAAYTVAGRIDSFALLPAMNFSIAISTFVGQNLGAGKVGRVKKGFLATWLMNSGISLIVSIIVMLFGHQLMGAFTSDPEVILIGEQYLFIVGAFYILFSTMFIANGVLRGAGDTLIPMFITLMGLWVIRIPVAYFLSRHIGINGIWWGVPAAWFVGSVLSVAYYLGGRWKRKVIVKPPSFPIVIED